MTRTEWLDSIKVGDTVYVFIGRQCKGAHLVTSAPRSMITIGKHAKKMSFRRSDGLMAGRKPMGHLFRIEPKEILE